MARKTSSVAAAKKVWGNVRKERPEDNNQFEQPEGTFMAVVTQAEMAMTSSTNRPCVKWQVGITEPEENEGKIIYITDCYDTEGGAAMLQRRIASLGYEVPDDLDDLEEVLQQIVEDAYVIKIRCKTAVSKKDDQEYYNVNILKVMSYRYDFDTKEEIDDVDDDEEEEPEEEEEEPEEEEPEEEEPEEEEDDVDDDDDEEDDVDDDEEEVELEEGATVEFELDGEDVQGIVKSIDEDAGIVKVKVDGIRALQKVDFDDIVIVESEDEDEEEEEEEEEPEPPKKRGNTSTKRGKGTTTRTGRTNKKTSSRKSSKPAPKKAGRRASRR